MNQKEKDSLYEYVGLECSNICQIVARKNGTVVYEDYWNGFKKNDCLHVFSVTKSIVSLLVGIAIEKGLIEGTEQPVLDFFPDYPIKRGEKTIQKVQIRHLLTMTAPYKYRSEPWTKVCSSDDWTFSALNLLGGREGITGTFKYATLGIQILTGILSRSCGVSALAFANENLFGPLEIPAHADAQIQTKEDHMDFVLSKKPKNAVWFSDPQGSPTAGWGLCLSASDMAKIGQACLDGGKFLDLGNWIREMTTVRYHCDETFGNMAYGYLWWIVDEAKGIYAAIGDGGNVIYVNPEEKMTVAISGTFKPRIFDRVQFIQSRIEPLLTR